MVNVTTYGIHGSVMGMMCSSSSLSVCGSWWFRKGHFRDVSLISMGCIPSREKQHRMDTKRRKIYLYLDVHPTNRKCNKNSYITRFISICKWGYSINLTTFLDTFTKWGPSERLTMVSSNQNDEIT